MKHIWFFFLFVFLGLTAKAQFNTKPGETEIYILTCSPGEDLYSVFGHAALVVKTPASDFVYNYGTFNFSTENFYLKFARGQLPYKLDKEKFGYFQYGYIVEHRQIWAQKLNFTEVQKEKLIALLEINMLPENVQYKYDFFYDNCATRLIDIVDEATENTIDWKTSESGNGHTFREMIEVYLTQMQWSDLGIDLALGIPCDYELKEGEQAFLPDSLKSMFQRAMLNGNDLVTDGYEVLPSEKKKVHVKLLDKTSSVLWIISTALLAVLFFYRRKTQSRILSAVILFINGLLGALIFFLWFFTDHSATSGNLNLLWASPLNLILPFIKFSRKIWLQIYSGIVVTTLMSWTFLAQDLHESLIPVILVSLYSALIYIRRIDE